MTRLQIVFLALTLLVSPLSRAEDDSLPDASRLNVAAPYLDLHAGPGRGFPVENSVTRGEVIEVIERHTDWYRIRTSHDTEGWVHRRALLGQETPGTPPVAMETRAASAIATLSLGTYDGTNAMSFGGEGRVMDNITVGGDVLTGGDFDRDIRYFGVTVRQYFEPMGFATPWVGGGAGRLSIDPTAGETATTSLPHVAAGADLHWLERTRLRLEYRHHIPNSSNTDLQETDEWKAGIAVYY